MLTSAARAHLAIVLVGARNPSNIGAAARAMQDFGFSDLRVVNDYAAPFDAAQLGAKLEAKSAVASAHILEHAQRFSSLADAIADRTLVIGTTAIGEREVTQPILPLQQSARLILDHLHNPNAATGAPSPALSLPKGADLETWIESPPSRVALLFGSEKTGLTNEQLSHCTSLTTIPMFQPEAARHLSMNLGQAVAVCLYELTRAGFEGAKPLPVTHEAAATEADRERLTQLLLDALHATGYTRRFPSNSTETIVRQLARQLGTSHREAMTWMGILRQILWRERREPAQ